MDQSASIVRPTIITRQMFGATYEVVIPVDVSRPTGSEDPKAAIQKASNGTH